MSFETIKPTMNGDDEEKKQTAISVLYECIESSLLVLHPFMSFITEDLWKRLPKRFDAESTMLTPYQAVNGEWDAYDDHVMQAAIICSQALRRIKTI